MSDIQIYVADLAAYNNGILYGAWIDATQDIEDIQEQIQDMLKAGPTINAEEYAIHDHEGFQGVSISEYEGIESVSEIAQFIEEHGELGAAVLSHWCGDIEDATKALEESYNGQYSSLADYAQSFIEETGEVPQHLEFYIDYERMAKDWEMSGDIYTIETAHDEVHIFSNH